MNYPVPVPHVSVIIAVKQFYTHWNGGQFSIDLNEVLAFATN